jgi:hypothetical protein
MRRILTTLAATAALALPLSACGADESSVERVSDVVDRAIESDPEPFSDTTVSDSDLADTVYLTTLRAEYPEAFAAVEDETLTNLGHAICDGFDKGVSWEQAALIALNSGYTVQQGGYLLGSAIAAYCPEHEGLMN